MPARLNHNVHLKQIHHNIGIHQASVARQIQHLASGNRVDRSSDDPASLALADGIRSEMRSIAEGRRNIQQTFSLLQVADGSLNEISSMINRMQSLTMQAASITFNDSDRLSIFAEFAALRAEIDRVAGFSTYNGKNLLTGFNSSVNFESSSALTGAADTGLSRVRLTTTDPGVYLFEDAAVDGEITLGNGVLSQTVVVDQLLNGGVVATGSHVVLDFDKLGIQITLSGADAVGGLGQYADGDLDGRTITVDTDDEFTFQMGPAETSNDVAVLGIADMRASGPTLNLTDVSILTISDARLALSEVRRAQDAVTSERNRIGAFQNRLQLSMETSSVVIDRMTSAEADIREVDLVRSVANMTKSQILAQVATSIAVEADSDIERILSLLG